MLIVSNWRLLGIPRVDVEHRKILRSLAVVSTSLRAAAQPLLFGCIGIEVPTSFGRINASEYRLRSLLQMSLQHPGAARWPKILYVFSSRGFIPLSHPLLLSIARLLEHFEALGELRILDVPITIRMLQAISRLAELEKLTFVDCDAVGSSGDVNTVIHCHNLKYLALRYTSTISPLRVFELGMHCALKTLEISSPTILTVLHQLGSDHELPTLTELIVASFKYTMQGPLSALLQLCPNIKNLKLDHHCGRTTEESPVPWPAAPDHSMLCLKIFSGPFQCATALIPRRPVEVMRICCAGREDVAQLAYASVPVKILELAGLHWHDGCLNTIANSFPGLEELALVDLAHDYMVRFCDLRSLPQLIVCQSPTCWNTQSGRRCP